MKKLLLLATVFLAACSSAPPTVVVPVSELKGVWSGPLHFNGGQTYTVYVNFDAGADHVMVFQEDAGYIHQNGAVAVYSASTRAVTVTWNDTLYSCESDTSSGAVHATLNAGATAITGTFEFDGVQNGGTVSLTPASGLPTPIKTCAK